MFKNFSRLFFLTICLLLIVANKVFPQSSERIRNCALHQVPSVNSNNFVLEEELVFSIPYWLLQAGDISIKTESQIKNGKKLYRFSMNMQTREGSTIHYWYPFQYQIISYSYRHPFLLPFYSCFFENNKDERNKTVITYDRSQQNSRACYTKQEHSYGDAKESLEKECFIVQGVNDPSRDIRDTLNALFYVRTLSNQNFLDLDPNSSFYVLLEKNKPLLGQILLLREEKIQVGYAYIDTFVLQLNFQKIGQTNKKNRFKNITAWITKGKRKIIVQVTFTLTHKRWGEFDLTGYMTDHYP